MLEVGSLELLAVLGNYLIFGILEAKSRLTVDSTGEAHRAVASGIIDLKGHGGHTRAQYTNVTNAMLRPSDRPSGVRGCGSGLQPEFRQQPGRNVGAEGEMITENELPKLSALERVMWHVAA